MSLKKDHEKLVYKMKLAKEGKMIFLRENLRRKVKKTKDEIEKKIKLN